MKTKFSLSKRDWEYLGNKSGWLKEAQMTEYPYYIARWKTSRAQGNYPLEFSFNSQMKKQYDRMVGYNHHEEQNSDPQQLLDMLRNKRIHPAYDDVEFYKVSAPGSHRERIQTQRFMNDNR